MGSHKLVLQNDFEEDFCLLAIHCSEEAYKLAYLLNKHLCMKLKRKRVDLDYTENGAQVSFPLFQFEDVQQYTNYFLVGNKSTIQTPSIVSSGLFDSDPESLRFSLLPEFSKADYFLKIESDLDTIPYKKILFQINEIAEVISSYHIENQRIKTLNHLIFN